MLRKTPLKRSTKPMARSGFKHKAALKAGTKRLRSRHKMTPIRASAKDEECKINLPFGVCNYDPSTTVLCHSNELADGKGMGLKAPDEFGAYGCSSCHDVVDGRRPRPPGLTLEMVEDYFKAGIERTREILRRKGLLKESVCDA